MQNDPKKPIYLARWKFFKLVKAVCSARYFEENDLYKLTAPGEAILETSAFRQSISSVWDGIEIPFCAATTEELLNKKAGTLSEILEVVRKHPSGLCPPWAGPVLRSQHARQPEGELLHLAMEPIRCSDGHLRIFIVMHHKKGGLLLHSKTVRPNLQCRGDAMWVFPTD